MTGAAGGLGREIAIRLGAKGFHVLVTDGVPSSVKVRSMVGLLPLLGVMNLPAIVVSTTMWRFSTSSPNRWMGPRSARNPRAATIAWAMRREVVST